MSTTHVCRGQVDDAVQPGRRAALLGWQLQSGALQQRRQVLLAGAVHDNHPGPGEALLQNLVCEHILLQ